MKPESNRPITIEDLLRLKRAEVPPPEFWSTFDRELRAKQLAALVGKRPWWQRLPGLWGGISRFRVPIGATALLVLTFVTVRYYDAPASVEVVTADASPVVVSDHEPAAPASVAVQEAAAIPVVAEPVSTSSVLAAVDAVSIDSPPSLESRETEVSGALTASSVAVTETDRDPDSPVARHIAANLAIVQASAAQSHARSLLEVASGFEARAMPARAAVEPLQQMTPPGDSRRSRLLTAMVSQASLDASMRATARAASRIEEERLYERIQRFGARGDQVNVKF